MREHLVKFFYSSKQHEPTEGIFAKLLHLSIQERIERLDSLIGYNTRQNKGNSTAQ